MIAQRTWTWENFYDETEEVKARWNAGAALLRNVNWAVIEDYRDWIICRGFQKANGSFDKNEVNKSISADLE